ncbi:MAG: magnesium transporter MgtC [Cyanobacteria bacterium QS_7_48_42]|nr:MAG: magnesium transporter MgtC [Cyanobacteria bacterium QH_2_48_84]PSO76864.1 MAG: magnesium transporter MgtC [Cyanobacteria bacterium QH_3_48_40]PSO89176.1 MAG: magnesium transporter MgtC [Cyanobacteria bacterium QS_3_48_167]PSO92770.1 MAG: magnesium transporter MgtC [Cyanobacteria bacterium QS_6_48_18]PSO96343.1 MAG: magnesium transporter MgtC [Cyanobacteria bacterium QS_9_48_30]PSO97170.1 MAG: magnesium transporter MgtC [Cyanobacteria bacterium SW_12_48_29]PSO99963.1 MAG: magnesium tra
MEFFSFDWYEVFILLLKLVSAFVLTFPIGWNRELSTRNVGLRTFPLVAVASCGYVLMALKVIGSAPGAEARVIQGLMTGVGFIGGGAILKQENSNSVMGTATAVSIWTTGVMGASVGYGHYEIALTIGAINFLALRTLTPIKQQISGDSEEGGDVETQPQEASEEGSQVEAQPQK